MMGVYQASIIKAKDFFLTIASLSAFFSKNIFRCIFGKTYKTVFIHDSVGK